jgi:hypothetical protein
MSKHAQSKMARIMGESVPSAACARHQQSLIRV